MLSAPKMFFEKNMLESPIVIGKNNLLYFSEELTDFVKNDKNFDRNGNSKWEMTVKFSPNIKLKSESSIPEYYILNKQTIKREKLTDGVYRCPIVLPNGNSSYICYSNRYDKYYISWIAPNELGLRITDTLFFNGTVTIQWGYRDNDGFHSGSTRSKVRVCVPYTMTDAESKYKLSNFYVAAGSTISGEIFNIDGVNAGQTVCVNSEIGPFISKIKISPKKNKISDSVVSQLPQNKKSCYAKNVTTSTLEFTVRTLFGAKVKSILIKTFSDEKETTTDNDGKTHTDCTYSHQTTLKKPQKNDDGSEYVTDPNDGTTLISNWSCNFGPYSCKGKIRFYLEVTDTRGFCYHYENKGMTGDRRSDVLYCDSANDLYKTNMIFTVLDWTPPKIEKFSVNRVDNNGKLSYSGTKIHIDWKMASGELEGFTGSVIDNGMITLNGDRVSLIHQGTFDGSNFDGYFNGGGFTPEPFETYTITVNVVDICSVVYNISKELKSASEVMKISFVNSTASETHHTVELCEGVKPIIFNRQIEVLPFAMVEPVDNENNDLFEFNSGRNPMNKWAILLYTNGFCQMFTRRSFVIASNAWNSWGNLFTTGGISDSNVNYNFFSNSSHSDINLNFKRKPVLNVTLSSGTAAGIIMPGGGGDSTTVGHTGTFEILRGTKPTTNVTYYLDYMASGMLTDKSVNDIINK